MESVSALTEFERKLITIIQHYNKKHKSPGISTLKIKTGQEETNVADVVQDLVRREWLVVRDKKLMVACRIF